MNHPQPRQSAGVRLAGTGMAIPQRVLTNNDLAKMVDTSDEWITRRTGIKQRYIGQDDTTVRQLALASMQQALVAAQIEPKDLDLLLLATMTPDMCCPATAVRVVGELGAAPAGAMDLNAACSGFVYALNISASLVQSGTYRHVGVVGAELLSRVVDWKDRHSCVLFGDGAGAVIVTHSPDPTQGCLYQSLGSNGNDWQFLYCPSCERDLPPEHDDFTGTYNKLQMNGRGVYKFAVETLLRTITEATDTVGIKPNDLDMIIPHQSNQRILESAREKLGIAAEKIYCNIDRYGNTSAASVPICLNELIESGRLRQGNLVLMVALGGGLTWATSLWRL